MDRQLIASIERAENVDLQTGEFPMILATDGEATDGDILSIEGAQFAKQAPLQMSHINDPTATLGTIRNFRRELASSPKKLKARGQIEVEGEGPLSDIRRDVLFMMSRGHVRGISVRWEPLEFTRRQNLPEDHSAYVPEDETDWRKRYGYFHKKWRVLEGSVVAVQADPASMVGRAEETEGAVSEFWTRMAEAMVEREHTRPDPAGFDNKDDFFKACIPTMIDEGKDQDQAVAACNAMWDSRGGAPKALCVHDSCAKEPLEGRTLCEEHEAAAVAEKLERATPKVALDAAKKEESEKKPTPEALQAALAAYVRELKAKGLDDDAIESVVAEELAPDPYEGLAPALRARLEKLDQLEARFAALEEGLKRQNGGAPSPPHRPTTKDALEYFEARMRQSGQRAHEALQAYVAQKRGSVQKTEKSARERLREEGEALLRETFEAEEDRHAVDAEALGSALAKLTSRLDAARKQLQKQLELQRQMDAATR